MSPFVDDTTHYMERTAALKKELGAANALLDEIEGALSDCSDHPVAFQGRIRAILSKRVKP